MKQYERYIPRKRKRKLTISNLQLLTAILAAFYLLGAFAGHQINASLDQRHINATR